MGNNAQATINGPSVQRRALPTDAPTHRDGKPLIIRVISLRVKRDDFSGNINTGAQAPIIIKAYYQYVRMMSSMKICAALLVPRRFFLPPSPAAPASKSSPERCVLSFVAHRPILSAVILPLTGRKITA